MNDNPRPEIPVFDRKFFGSEQRFTRVGNGEIGGKASGLYRISREIIPALTLEGEDDFEIQVPTLTVLTTEVFDNFMARNDLAEIAYSEAPDDHIAHAFQRAELPAEIVGDLRALIANVHTPLAIRSSSLLEDALEHPFAGVYATKMIPNNEIEEDARYRRLLEGIKLVLASTFFRDSKAYISSIGLDIRSEKMAVILQEIVGRRFGTRFYPAISGVGRSYNYYPSGHSVAEDGIVNLALGLGRSIVDGGNSWNYCPEYPRAPPPFNSIGDLLKNTQTRFWAVNMGEPPLPDPLEETECLVQSEIQQAEDDHVLKYLVSTYDPGSDRLNPGLGGRGARALTFAPILSSFFIPFNDMIKELLSSAASALDSAVEIEFAVDADPESFVPARVGFLQVRPMAVEDSSVDVEEADFEDPRTIVASSNVLGNGIREGIHDIVFVKADTFDTTKTLEIARELEDLNSRLVREGRPYVLIGFGRWGTSDRFFGIPVTWPQISNAKVIVEATLEGVNPEMSQGSHFFHNVISFQILYFSLAHNEDPPINWSVLEALPAELETGYIKHLRVDPELVIRVDGTNRRGVIRYDG